MASIADRVVDSVGSDAFKAATAVPAISPVLSQSFATDLVVTYDNLHDPNGTTITAVVLKPRNSTSVYQMPTPAPSDNLYDFLHFHIDSAVQQAAGTIEFPPSYHFALEPPIPIENQASGALEQEAHLNFRGLDDVVIDLNGSTIEFTQKVLGIRVEDSHRVVIKNGSIKGTGLLSTIATVKSDSTEAGIKFDVLPQFESELESLWNGNPDVRTVGSAEQGPTGAWRIKAEDYAELFTNRGKPHNNFDYSSGEFIATSHLLDDNNPFTIGHNVYLLHENNSAHGLYLDNDDGGGVEDITIENVTFSNIPGMVVVGEIDRGLHLDNVEIAVDSVTQAYLGASSDGIHINANGGDIVIENSILGPNGDDKITIKGNYWEVASINQGAKTMQLRPIENGISVSRWGRANNDIVFIDNDFNVIGEAELDTDSIRPEPNGNTHNIKLKSIPSGVGVNSIVGNVDMSGGRVIIRNNDFSETRSQAILLQTSHVVVEGNSLEGMGGPAITLELALEDWYESINTNNILLKDNIFSRTSQSVSKSNELIHFYQVDGNENPVDVIDNIIITGNQLEDPNSQPDTTPPEVSSISLASPAVSNAATVDFNVVFSEVVTGVDLADFVLDSQQINGASILSASGSGSVYTVSVDTGTGDGFVSIDFDTAIGGGVLDLSANASVESFDLGDTYTIDKTPPPVSPTIDSITDDTDIPADFVTDDQSLVIAGTWDESTVDILTVGVDETVYTLVHDPELTSNGSGNWTLDLASMMLGGGSHTITAEVSDIAGNSVSSTQSLTIDVPIVELHYLNKSPQTISDEVEAQLELYNRSGADLDYLGMEMRYYFDPDGLIPLVEVTSLNAPSSSIDVTYDPEGHIKVQVIESLALAPDDRLKVRFLVTAQNGGTFDQSNDPSFDAAFVVRGPSIDIDVFQNGVLVWGNTPPPPTTPTIDYILDDTDGPGDFITSDATLIVGGTWTDGSGVLSVELSGIEYQLGVDAELSTDGLGNWSLDVTNLTLPNGLHQVIAKVDDNGNTSTSNQDITVNAPIVVPLGDVGRGIAGIDNAVGNGYILHSNESVFTRFSAAPPIANNSEQLVAVRQHTSGWQYANNSAWYGFTPNPTDRLLAFVDYEADSITPLLGVSGTVDGIEQGFSESDLVFIADYWNGLPNDGEFTVAGSYFSYSSDENSSQTVLLGDTQKGVAVADSAAGTAYMMFTTESVHSRFALDPPHPKNANHVIAVRYSSGQWEYNSNATWISFVPRQDDRLLASIDFDAGAVHALQGQSGSVSGIEFGYVVGDVSFLADSWGGNFNAGEFEVFGNFFVF